VGRSHSIFVDMEGSLLTCGSDLGLLSWHAMVADAAWHAMVADAEHSLAIGPPTPVISMEDTRIVSVAITSYSHSLALSAQDEVYAWGRNGFGALGLGNFDDRAVPRKIESLNRIARIAVCRWKSAAVDEDGRLFTWGLATVFVEEEDQPVDDFSDVSALGYALSPDVHGLPPEGQQIPRS